MRSSALLTRRAIRPSIVDTSHHPESREARYRYTEFHDVSPTARCTIQRGILPGAHLPKNRVPDSLPKASPERLFFTAA